jgi:Ku protein
VHPYQSGNRQSDPDDHAGRRDGQRAGTPRPRQRLRRKNQYVLLSDKDFDSVKVESSSLITIEKFIDKDSIDPVYYGAAYYLSPDGDAGRDMHAVLREAIAKTGKTAVARVVISRRERTIAIRRRTAGTQATIERLVPRVGEV